MGKKRLFRNFILLILCAINFIIVRIDILFFDNSAWFNSHLSKFLFRHSWQEQRFSFPTIRPLGKKAIMCNFSDCKILNSSLDCFMLLLPDDLQKQLCIPSLGCQVVSAVNALSPVLHHWKKIFCDDTFSERPFYPEIAHRTNQPFAVSWNTIIQNYSLIVLFG